MYYGIEKPLYPIVNIFLSVFVLSLGLFMKTITQNIYFIFFFIIIIFLSGYFWIFLKIFLIFIPIGLVIALISYLITRDIGASLMTICRFSILGLTVVFTLNVKPTELSRVLTQIGCPRKISIAILITYRFIPVLKQEINRIIEAMKVRGVKFHWWNPIQSYSVIFLPLMIRIISISDTLALSLETRGFSSKGKSTFYKKIILKKKDIFITILTILGTIIILFYS